MSENKKKQCKELKRFKSLLKQEIELRREILSMKKQEEYALMTANFAQYESIRDQNAYYIKSANHISQSRISIMQQVVDKNPSYLEESFAICDEMAFMQTELTHLIEAIHAQKEQNKRLKESSLSKEFFYPIKEIKKPKLLTKTKNEIESIFPNLSK